MAEPTLALTYDDFVSEVGGYLGWGRGVVYGETVYVATQLSSLESCVRSGVRQFYVPPPIPGVDSPYDWSFLHPLATMTLASGTSLIAMPDDFSSPEGRVTVSANGTSWWPLDIVGFGTIVERAAALPTTTGRPCMASIEPTKGTTATEGQRFQMRLWPTSDQAYSLQVQYYLNPDALTTALPYVYGGSQHSETVLESCLAIAEQRINDQIGVHTAKFTERLIASIGMDRKLKPQLIGYNRDMSDLRDRRFGSGNRLWGGNGISVGGVVY